MTMAEAVKEDSGHGTLTDPENTTNPEFGPAQPFQGVKNTNNSSVHMTHLDRSSIGARQALCTTVRLQQFQHARSRCSQHYGKLARALFLQLERRDSPRVSAVQRACLHVPRGDEHCRRLAESHRCREKKNSTLRGDARILRASLDARSIGVLSRCWKRHKHETLTGQ